MLRASALFYAVTVALLIGMVSAAIVLLAHFREVETERWLAQERATSNARSAVQLACAGGITDAQAQAVDLFGDGADSVLVHAEDLGLLDRVAVRAWVGPDEVELSAIIGPRAGDPRVLVLGGADIGALNVCGDTRITGDVVVPNADVRRGYIEGRPFAHEQLVDGAITASPRGSIAVGSAVIDRIQRSLGRLTGTGAVPLTLAGLAFRTDTGDAFAPVPVVDLHGQRSIDQLRLKGPLVLRSADTLEIGADVDLDMVVVQAPFIAIRTLRPATVQCFAERGVEVGAGTVLSYPSAVVVIAEAEDAGQCGVTLDSAAVVEGAVIAAVTARSSSTRSAVSIAPYATVRGEVLCDGLVEQRGTVQGTVWANGISLRTASSTYRGHLLDAILERPPLGAEMGALATRNDEHKQVLRWTAPRHRPRVRG